MRLLEPGFHDKNKIKVQINDLMIRVYCEDGSMTKGVKKLKQNPVIELISFPFENQNKHTVDAKKPSDIRASSTSLRASSTIKIGDMARSNIFDSIEKIIGRENISDIRHVDTAYKERCDIFISPDKRDIVSKNEELFNLTGIKFFYCEDMDSIQDYIEELSKKRQIKYSNKTVKGFLKIFVLSLLIGNLVLYLWSLDEGKEVLRYNGGAMENLPETFEYYFFWVISYWWFYLIIFCLLTSVVVYLIKSKLRALNLTKKLK